MKYNNPAIVVKEHGMKNERYFYYRPQDTIKPNYPVPVIPDNHEYLASRKFGRMPANEWLELWHWSNRVDIAY